VTVFAVALVTAVMVTLLLNIIWHAENTIDWETAFLFAILFGIIQAWVKSREMKEI
jgi:di/tricarboxylate transporter